MQTQQDTGQPWASGLSEALPCSWEWIQSWPQARRHRHPNKTCQSSCRVETWRLSLGCRANKGTRVGVTPWQLAVNLTHRCPSNCPFDTCKLVLSYTLGVRDPLTCLQAPGHLEEEHTWSLAKTHGRDSLHPDSRPCGEHEPAGLPSAEDMEREGCVDLRSLWSNSSQARKYFHCNYLRFVSWLKRKKNNSWWIETMRKCF